MKDGHGPAQKGNIKVALQMYTDHLKWCDKLMQWLLFYIGNGATRDNNSPVFMIMEAM